MGRYNLNDSGDNDTPWWVKALAILAVAGVGAIWHRLQLGYW